MRALYQDMLTKKALKNATQAVNLAVAMHATGSALASEFIVRAADILGCRLAGNDLSASIDILRCALASARCEITRARALAVSHAMFPEVSQ
jgi:hypothetical protein